jgi:short-subunit dehydrogenase
MADSTANRTNGRPLALVTGASSGIGLELARIFVQEGYDVVIAAEDAGIQTAATELRAIGLGGRVEPMQVDLTKHEGVDRLAARFTAADGRAPDAVALNAGIGLGHAFIEQDLERAQQIIDLNVTSTVRLTHRLLPAMVARGEGKLLYTSSIAALMPGAFQAVYNASKAFVHSFSEAIRNELKDTGITVTALQPGATDTNFFARADMEDTRVAQDPLDDPAMVARTGYDAMVAGKDHVVAGMKNKVQAVLSEITPETLKAEQHRRMAEPGSGSK